MTLLAVRFGHVHVADGWSLRTLCGRDLTFTVRERREGGVADVNCPGCLRAVTDAA